MCVLVSHCLLRDAAMLPASSTPPCRARCARTGDRVIHRYHRLDRTRPVRWPLPRLRIGSIGPQRRAAFVLGWGVVEPGNRDDPPKNGVRAAVPVVVSPSVDSVRVREALCHRHRTAQRRTARPRGFAQASLLACLFGRWLGRFRPSLGGWCCCLVVVLVFGVVWWWWWCLVVCLECTAPGSNGTAMGGSSFAPSVSVSRGQSRPGWRSLPPLPACYAAAVSSSPLPLLQYYRSQDPGEGNRLLG